MIQDSEHASQPGPSTEGRAGSTFLHSHLFSWLNSVNCALWPLFTVTDSEWDYFVINVPRSKSAICTAGLHCNGEAIPKDRSNLSQLLFMPKCNSNQFNGLQLSSTNSSSWQRVLEVKENGRVQGWESIR